MQHFDLVTVRIADEKVFRERLALIIGFDDFSRGKADLGEALVLAIHSLADSLGLDSVAEGVENEVQREALVALGCTQGQGWHFAKAVDVAEASAMLKAARPQANA